MPINEIGKMLLIIATITFLLLAIVFMDDTIGKVYSSFALIFSVYTYKNFANNYIKNNEEFERL